MHALPHRSHQLPLGLDPPPAATGIAAVTIPTPIEADVIDTLATLLLEAAGAARSPDAGGADESEDHA